MNASDLLTDDQNRQWTLGRALSRGLWSRSWLVESSGGRKAVLHAPLGSADLGGSDAMAATCRAGILETAGRLRKGERGLPELLGTISLEQGVTGLLVPAGPSLQHRLDAGDTFVGTAQSVLRAATYLEGQVHGEIHHSSMQVLSVEGADIDVRIGLPLPSTLLPHLPRLEELASRKGWRPPEAGAHPEPMWDSWALCRILWIAATTPPTSGEASRPRVDAPEAGPDKVAIATLRDRVMARLAHEQTNPRFRSRVSEKLGTLLNRGLSREHEPSPPYRFSHTGSLAERLSEVLQLVSPTVNDVGRVILGDGKDGSDGNFLSGTAVRVAVSVGCSHGTADHEDVVAGLRLVDQDAPGDGRVALEEAKFAVRNHPSGRLRFEFTIPELPPGRYKVRCAFAIKDSGDEPKVAEGAFEVRPAPGYVPPAPEPTAAPIVIPARPAAEPVFPPLLAPARSENGSEDDSEDAPTVMMSGATLQEALAAFNAKGDDEDPSDPSDVGAELIEGVFPRPIAPPAPREPVKPVFSAPVQLDEEPADAVVRAFPGVSTTDISVPPSAVPSGPRIPPPPLAAVPTAPPTEPTTSHGFRDATGGMEAPSLGSAWMEAGRDDEPYDSASEGDNWAGGPGALRPLDAPADGLAIPDMATEDLPTYDADSGGSDLLERLKATLFRDTTTAVGVASAMSLLLVLVLVLVLRAC